MSVTDFIPHGMVAAFAGVVSFVYREHIKQDDKRFDGIKQDLTALITRQTEISDKLASNHAEILKTLLQAANQRETNAAIAASRE